MDYRKKIQIEQDSHANRKKKGQYNFLRGAKSEEREWKEATILKGRYVYL